MRAFRSAWDLLKMPIVQGSAYRDDQHDDDFERYNAAFDDPITGERMNMETIFYPDEYITTTIEAPPHHTYKLHPRATGTFVLAGDEPDERQTYSATGIGTEDEYRRRGYATAIYDLVAAILDKYGADLEPSAEQSELGFKFWQPVLEGGVATWPISRDLLKMPFVPGSIRVEGVDEADDEYEERTRYEADFFDPVDNKTRRMRLHPLPRRKPRPEGAPRPLFGGGPPETGIITSIELPDEDLREPEMMFGREQQEPFAFFRDWHSGLMGDRIFVPSHLRGSERGIADALLDATVELRQNLGQDARITPDLLQTKDAIRFFHDRTGNYPKAVFPMDDSSTVGDDTYYRTEYGSYRIGGEHPNDPAEWNSRTNRGKVSFDDAWQQMFMQGQLQMQEKEEMARYYERAYNCTVCGGSEEPDCEHALGHPWFEEYHFLDELHPNTRKEHEQMKSLYPATWALHEMRREAER